MTFANLSHIYVGRLQTSLRDSVSLSATYFLSIITIKSGDV